jgi:hypothetical protein
VIVDFNQNAPHKTVFGAWCVRASPHGQVSTPFAWPELESITPAELTIATVPGRLAERGDPWAAMSSRRESLEPLLDLHRRDVADGVPDAPWLARLPEDAGRATEGGAVPCPPSITVISE